MDETGRHIRDDKRGFIDGRLPALITRFNINPDEWLQHIQQFGQRYASQVGSREKLADCAKQIHCRWLKGVGYSERLYRQSRAA